MNFPLNQLELDAEYISAVEENIEGNILAKFSVFKRDSSALAKAFNIEQVKYDSLQLMPKDILLKYSNFFYKLLDINKSLKGDLETQMHKINKDMEYNYSNYNEISCINMIYMKKHKSLYLKIKYIDSIEMLYMAIDFCLKNR